MKLPWPRKHSQKKEERPIEPVTGVNIHRMRRPFQPEPATLGTLQAWVVAKAKDDAKKRTDDAVSIRHLRRLSGEAEIHDRIELERQSYRQMAIGEMNLQYDHIQEVRAQGANGRSITRLEELIQDQRGFLEDATKERESASTVLKGEKPDRWGRSLRDDVPPITKTSTLNLATTVLVICLWLGEVAATIPVATSMFLSDGQSSTQRALAWLFMAGFLILVAVVLLFAPITIGNQISGPVASEERRRWAKTVTISALMGLLWILSVAVLSLSRIYFSMSANSLTEMEERDAMFRGFGTMIHTLFASREGLLFMSLFLLAGIIIIVIHARKNPYQEAVIRANKKIETANKEISALTKERDTSMAELQIAENESEGTRQSWLLREKDGLTTWERSLIQLFRTTYANECADPDISDALQWATACDDNPSLTPPEDEDES